jgi:hypothetical protein
VPARWGVVPDGTPVWGIRIPPATDADSWLRRG